MKKRILCIVLVILVVTGMLPATTFAGNEMQVWQTALQKSHDYLMTQAEETTFSVGGNKGEWVVLGLLRNGADPAMEVCQRYVAAAESFITQNGENGRLDSDRSTLNSRVILALTAMGQDATNISGENLLAGLDDLDYMTAQGLNGGVWALIAVDCKPYSLQNVTQEQLIDYILSEELPNGGWAAVSGQDYADDMTPMAIQALAPYYNRDTDVKNAVDRALQVMVDMPWDYAETCAQIVVALSALGIDANTDEQYFKDGISAVETLLSFAAENGAFYHKRDSTKVNQMATEQAFYALVAYNRFTKGQTSLYDMSDLAQREERFAVELLPCENGKITVNKTIAAAGETVEITAEPAVGYELSGLLVNDEPLDFEDDHAAFFMPEGTAIVEAVFSVAQEGALAVGEAMAAFEVKDASQETLEKIEDIIAAYRLLTAPQKLELRDAYYAFQEKADLFQQYLAEAIADAKEELEDFFDELDEDLYSEDAWEEIEELYDKALEVLKEARYQEEVDELLEDYLEELQEISVGELEVTFRLIGDWLHEDETSDHEEYVTWIETTEYLMPGESTVYDLLMLALEDNDLSQKGAKKGYVEGIRAPEILGGYWLQEFDNGSNSGWMYTVNGDHPDMGLTEQVLEDGDEVIWHYVDNFSVEERKETWLEAEDISPKNYVKHNLEKIVTIEGEGEVKPGLKASHIGDDVDFLFLPDEGWMVENVCVDGRDKGAIESYTYRDLAMDARIEVVFAQNMTFQMNFVDVSETQWFYDDVYFAVSNGLFNGTDEFIFSPDAPMTRAMLVTVLYRLEGEPAVYGGNVFTDVADNGWYADAVAWASRNGLINGYDNGKFGVNDNVTREQMASILYRYAQYKGYDTTEENKLTQYSDYSEMSLYALQAMKWANAEGLITGRTAATLAPKGSATRAEVAAIFHRFAENIAK